MTLLQSEATNHGCGGVDDLGPDALLAALGDAGPVELAVAQDKLVIAHQWCVLHPATAVTGVPSRGDPQLRGELDADESFGW